MERTNIELIKERINCIEVAQMCDLKVSKSGDRCKSFLHDGKNDNSMVVFNDYWYSFSDCKGGDCIDLLALARFEGDRGKAIRTLAQRTGVELASNNDRWMKYTQNLCNTIEMWHKRLLENDEVLDYMHSRRINDDTISKLKIGFNGRIVIPMWKNGYIAYYIARAWGNKKPKYLKPKLDGLLENDIFGLDTLDRSKDLLVIAEGAFDYLSFYQEGYAVIATCGGNFNKTQTKRVMSICKQFDKVLLTFDNDASGNMFTTNMAKNLYNNKVEFVCAAIPQGYKDISEYYCDGKPLSALLSTATKGVDYLLSCMENDGEFEDFARDSCRFMSRTDVYKLFNNENIKNRFDNEWLKELKKDCMKAPSDVYVVEQVLKKHTLKFNGTIGFYEWNGTHWIVVPKEKICEYISKELGTYVTGPRIRSILTCLEAEVATEEIMNNKKMVNFINGALDIETGDFVPHNPSHRCGYVLNYPYDADARCEEWEEFIHTVVGGMDDAKEELLRYLAGYILYPNNSDLQKCALLIGSGSNGKSVYLQVLTALLGGPETGNVSSIEMSSFSKDFQVIHLMNSMLNISSETKSNVSGAESVFKQAVAGDTISACYKGKDYISFQTRSKCFIACNEMPKVGDITNGWFRRFCMVEFPMKFCDNPKAGTNELKADHGLLGRLLETDSLSGIFNWVYGGYKDLCHDMEFPEPFDTYNIQEEYMDMTEPLRLFVKDVEILEKMSTDRLYEEYKMWAEKNNHRLLNSFNFSRRFKALTAELRMDVRPYRDKYTRGYKPWNK